MEQNYGFTEQAVNKIVEFAISRHIKQVDHLEAKLKFSWDKLAQGEVESMLIRLQGLYLPQALRTENLQLQIGRVKVKPLLAVKGQIHLTQPAIGQLEIIVHQADLTQALRLAISKDSMSSTPNGSGRALQSAHIECCFQAEHKIAVHCKFPEEKATEKLIDQTNESKFTAKIQVSNQQELVFSDIQESETEQFSKEFIQILIKHLNTILSLHFFVHNGMALRIDRVEVMGDRLLIHAHTQINFFPHH